MDVGTREPTYNNDNNNVLLLIMYLVMIIARFHSRWLTFCVFDRYTRNLSAQSAANQTIGGLS